MICVVESQRPLQLPRTVFLVPWRLRVIATRCSLCQRWTLLRAVVRELSAMMGMGQSWPGRQPAFLPLVWNLALPWAGRVEHADVVGYRARGTEATPWL